MMAFSEKRQLEDGDGVAVEVDQLDAVEQPASKRARISEQQTVWLSGSTTSIFGPNASETDPTSPLTKEDLLTKLPGEIRNKIYNLVLLPIKYPFNKDSYHGRHHGSPFSPLMKDWGSLRLLSAPLVSMEKTMPKGRRDVTTTIWREPGLLQVSKQIRSETKPLYYFGHLFSFHVRSDEFDRVYSWLSNLSQQLNGKWPEFELEVLNPNWSHMDQWLPLAKLAHESSFVKNAEGSVTEDTVWDNVSTKRDGFVRFALHDVVKLGAKAKVEGKTPKEMKVDFRRWVDTEGKRACGSSAWKKIQEARWQQD